MEVLFRPSALAAVARYDRFRRRSGYEPIGDKILDAIERRLKAPATWEEIAAPLPAPGPWTGPSFRVAWRSGEAAAIGSDGATALSFAATMSRLKRCPFPPDL